MKSVGTVARKWKSCAGIALAGGFTFCGSLSATHAANITYSGTGGNFSDGPSWVGGVAPGAADIAIFDTANPSLNITQVQANTVSGLDILDIGMTFDLAGFLFDVAGNAGIDVGQFGTASSSVTFQSSVPGAVLEARSLEVDAPTGATADMVVTGPNITFQNTAIIPIEIGGFAGGVSSLSILDQATFNTGSSDLRVNTTGTLTVSSNALFNVDDDVFVSGGTIIGLNSNTNFNWADGKTFTISGGGSVSGLSSAYHSPANSTWNVTGAGSTLSGTGNVFSLVGASSINVSDGGSWTKAVFIEEGSTLTADGADTTVGTMTIISGSATLTNGVIGTNLSSFDIGDFVSGGGGGLTGTLNILSGSSLTQSTFSTMRMANSGSDSDGVVNIDGSGSLLGVGNATLGGFSGATAEINITNGGSYTTNGFTLLNPTATININGGTALLGDLTDNGGTINFTSGTFGHNGSISIDPSSMLGSNINTSTKSLIFGGTISVNAGSTLTIDGGIVSAGSLQNTGTINYISGILELTSDDLEVDFGGLLSRTPTIAAGQDVRVTNSVNVSSAGLLTIDGGTITAGTLSNSGIVQMTGLSSLIGDGNVDNNGTISGTGVVNASLSNNAAGEVRADTGDMLIFNGPGNTNTGLIDNLHGTVQFNGDLTNGATGVIASGSTLKVLGGLTNAGNVAVSGGTSNVFGNITNTASGSISVTGNSAGSFFGTMDNSGDVFVSADSRATFLNDVSGAGTFSGTGTIEFANGFSPGSSPGTVSFGGDVLLSGAAELLIELGGLIAGSEFDQLDIAGDITLDGVLDIALINGFTPSPGNTFQIINAGSRTGEFDSITGNDLGGGVMLDVIYSATGVTLEVVGGLPGDLDGDGFVGINDLNIVLGNWNLNAPPANPLADPSGDGFVGIDDLGTVLGNWNAGTPPAVSQDIPEPGTLSLLVVMGSIAMCRKDH